MATGEVIPLRPDKGRSPKWSTNSLAPSSSSPPRPQPRTPPPPPSHSRCLPASPARYPPGPSHHSPPRSPRWLYVPPIRVRRHRSTHPRPHKTSGRGHATAGARRGRSRRLSTPAGRAGVDSTAVPLRAGITVCRWTPLGATDSSAASGIIPACPSPQGPASERLLPTGIWPRGAVPLSRAVISAALFMSRVRWARRTGSAQYSTTIAFHLRGPIHHRGLHVRRLTRASMTRACSRRAPPIPAASPLVWGPALLVCAPWLGPPRRPGGWSGFCSDSDSGSWSPPPSRRAVSNHAAA